MNSASTSVATFSNSALTNSVLARSLLPVEHAGPDLDGLDHRAGGILAGLLALADHADGGLVADGEAVDHELVAQRSDMRLAQWGCGFHGSLVAPYGGDLTEPL